MNRTLFFSTCVISSMLLDDPRIEPFDVRSPNQRFEARVRVVASDPRMARTDPRVELEVVELRDGGEHRHQWSGLYPFRERKGAHFLTDDGSAFVCVDTRAVAHTPLVVVVKKGLALASFDADALAIELDSGAKDPVPWLDPNAETCRVRTIPQGLDKLPACDLLGRDGALRTIDLSTGALTVFGAHAVTEDVTAEPACPRDATTGAEGVYLNTWAAPQLIVAGDALDVSMRGYYPTPGWRLLGFQLEQATNDRHSWTLVPLATHGDGAAAAVTRPFEATAHVRGLTEGIHRISVRGRGGPPVLESRSVEVLPRGLCARLVERDAKLELVQELVLYADGRLRTKHVDGSRVVLAREDGCSRASELALQIDPRSSGQRSSDPGSKSFELSWIHDGKPARVSRSESTLEGAAGDLVALLLDLAEAHPAASAPPRFELDRDASHFYVQTSSSGLLSAFGHDHKIEIKRFKVDLAADVDADLAALAKGSLTITIDAGSLSVVDQESAKDAPEIEREMRDNVLHVARHAEIVFKSTKISAEPAGGGVIALKITGELSLHGKTRSITVPARLEIQPGELGAQGEFSIRQADYDIEPSSAVGGTVKVADKVKLVFDLRLRRR